MTPLHPALANILHLLDLPERPHIGQLGLSGTELASALAAEPGQVVDLGPAGQPPPGALDVVVLWGAEDERAAAALRPSGWLVQFRPFAGRGTKAHSFGRERVTDVRRWLVSPGLHFPYAIVPHTRPAMRSHELATRGIGWKRRIRLVAIHFGWPAREFTGEVVAVRFR